MIGEEVGEYLSRLGGKQAIKKLGAQGAHRSGSSHGDSAMIRKKSTIRGAKVGIESLSGMPSESLQLSVGGGRGVNRLRGVGGRERKKRAAEDLRGQKGRGEKQALRNERQGKRLKFGLFQATSVGRPQERGRNRKMGRGSPGCKARYLHRPGKLVQHICEGRSFGGAGFHQS